MNNSCYLKMIYLKLTDEVIYEQILRILEIDSMKRMNIINKDSNMFNIILNDIFNDEENSLNAIICSDFNDSEYDDIFNSPLITPSLSPISSPISSFSKIKNKNNCIVCLEEDNMLLYNHTCGSYYVHLDCISKWFLENGNTCIICRNKIESDKLDRKKKFMELIKNIFNNRLKIYPENLLIYDFSDLIILEKERKIRERNLKYRRFILNVINKLKEFLKVINNNITKTLIFISLLMGIIYLILK